MSGEVQACKGSIVAEGRAAQKFMPGKFHIRGGTVARGKSMRGKGPWCGRSPEGKEPQQEGVHGQESPDLSLGPGVNGPSLVFAKIDI